MEEKTETPPSLDAPLLERAKYVRDEFSDLLEKMNDPQVFSKFKLANSVVDGIVTLQLANSKSKRAKRIPASEKVSTDIDIELQL